MWQRVAIRQGRSLIKHVLPGVVKPLHSLWNEVIGFVFCSLGVIFGVNAIRYLRQGDTPRTFVAVCCTLIMAWYGISSFRRARKISRS